MQCFSHKPLLGNSSKVCHFLESPQFPESDSLFTLHWPLLTLCRSALHLQVFCSRRGSHLWVECTGNHAEGPGKL